MLTIGGVSLMPRIALRRGRFAQRVLQSKLVAFNDGSIAKFPSGLSGASFRLCVSPLPLIFGTWFADRLGENEYSAPPTPS